MQHMTNITNLSDVIPTMESIPCPDCGNRVTISPHPNSHFIARMDDCLYHGQCKNIACQTCSIKKKVFLVCIACLATNNNRSVHGSTHSVHKSTKTATKHAKTQQHMNSMKYWKKILLKHVQQQKSSINDYSCDNDEMIQPSVSEQSDNISITETKLPSWNLTSLNELKNHGFDHDSNAPAFYWSEHKLPGSGVRNLTTKAFSLHTEQVSNAEARFSLTISNLLIQITESQRELFAQCMLNAANSNYPHLSIFEHTRVPTSEDDFQKFYLSGLNAIVPNLPHPIPKTTTDGTHSFVGLTDLLANELAKATTFDKFYFESNVQFLPKDVTTLSTTLSAYQLYLDLKEDDQDQYVLYIIKVKMGKLLLCVDRPERTSILQVGDHNGTISTFWRHSCKVDRYCKENHLPSCKE